MLELPQKFILFDTEFTAWEGSRERKWSGLNEHREIVQIGAIKVNNESLSEINTFEVFIKPTVNPELSEYFIHLTGIHQDIVDTKGTDYVTAITAFKNWCGDLPIYSFGRDGDVVKENYILNNASYPFLPDQFHNIRDFFKSHGIPEEQYNSSTIVRAFGVEPTRTGHDALNDARTILDGLKLLDKSTNSLS